MKRYAIIGSDGVVKAWLDSKDQANSVAKNLVLQNEVPLAIFEFLSAYESARVVRLSACIQVSTEMPVQELFHARPE